MLRLNPRKMIYKLVTLQCTWTMEDTMNMVEMTMQWTHPIKVTLQHQTMEACLSTPATHPTTKEDSHLVQTNLALPCMEPHQHTWVHIMAVHHQVIEQLSLQSIMYISHPSIKSMIMFHNHQARMLTAQCIPQLTRQEAWVLATTLAQVQVTTTRLQVLVVQAQCTPRLLAVIKAQGTALQPVVVIWVVQPVTPPPIKVSTYSYPNLTSFFIDYSSSPHYSPTTPNY